MSGTPANGHDVMLLQSDAANRTITDGALIKGPTALRFPSA